MDKQNFKKYIIRIFIIIIFFLNFIYNSVAKEYYRIFFIDKGPEKLELYNELYYKTINSLSKKSLERRKKISSNNLVTFEDVHIYQPYLDTILKFNIKIIHKLKWKNYIVAEFDSLFYNKIASLSFVKKIQKTSSKFISSSVENINHQNSSLKNNIISIENDTLKNTFYGNSYLQINSLGIDKLQQYGIWGYNVLIGFLDSGFDYKTHKSFKNINVVDEYDFINLDKNTRNENNDIENQHNHGTIVLSVTASLDSNYLIGSSPKSDFVLAKTENLVYEQGIEEDNFAAAVEWMDSIGVDVINASLGYKNFDSLNYNYSKEDLDGNTSLCTQYVNMAIDKGIVFVVASGNAGDGTTTINAPADAVNAITVGSIDSNLVTISPFSSRGPNYLDVIKPDFVALGNRPFCVSLSDSLTYNQGKGTSLAAPLISGGVSLLLSLFPELTPKKIKEILKDNSNNKENPNNNFGWGLPDFYNAAKSYDLIISPINYYKINNYLRVFCYVISNNLQSLSMFVKFKHNFEFIEFKLLKTDKEYEFYTDIPINYFSDFEAKAFIKAISKNNVRRYPFYDNDFLAIDPSKEQIHYGIKLPETILSKNDENNINHIILINSNFNYKFDISNLNTKKLNITITNLLGKVCFYNYIKNENELYLNNFNFPSGLYIIKISDENNYRIYKIYIQN